MRILLVSPYDITLPGGVTSHVLDLANQYRSMGYETTLVGPAGRGKLPQNEFTYHLGGTFRFLSPGDAASVNISPFLIGQVREFLKGKRFDVLHLHEPFLPFIGPSFLRYGEGTKVGTFHTWRIGPHIPYMLSRPLIRYWNRSLDGRITVSETARSTINRYVPDDYTIIPNGVSVPRFSEPVPCPEHLADERPTILFVGRLESRKGIRYLLQAFATVKKDIPSGRLVLVGEGGLRAELEQQALSLGLKDVLFEGYVRPEELPGYYQRANVFVAPSTANESFGITLLEAMSAGTPVVATTIRGFHTLGQNGVTALMVPPKDPQSLAEAILTALEDRALRDSLIAGGYEKALQFDWERVASQLLEYYARAGRSTPVPAYAAL